MASTGLTRRCLHCECPLMLLASERRKVCVRCRTNAKKMADKAYVERRVFASPETLQKARESRRDYHRQYNRKWYAENRETILLKVKNRYHAAKTAKRGTDGTTGHEAID